LKSFLENYNSEITTSIECFPKEEIIKFIKNKKLSEEDLLLIHFSGHGENIGRKINGKMEMLSSWVNPDDTLVSSFVIDQILSKINCKILLSSDSCHSGKFGDFFTGESPFLFLGSSSIINVSKEYNINSEKTTGILVCLIEQFFKNITIDFKDFVKMSNAFLSKNKIKIKPVFKRKNF